MDYEVRNNLLESENKLYKAELEARLDKIKELEERVKFLEEENNNLKNELMEDMKYETKLEEENKTLYKKLQEIGENNFELEKENKNLKLTLEQMENTCKDYLNDRDTLREENKKLKEEIGKLVMKS